MGCFCVNKMIGFLTSLCLTWVLINASDDTRVHVCSPIQYLELGFPGTINCDFSRYTYSGIFWYNSTERFGQRPLLSFKNSAREGRGYDSGEFDIHANGSMIIKKVTLQHDHIFSVAFVRTPDENTFYDDVVVIVTVKPSQDHPMFEHCYPSQVVCLRRLNQPFYLTCYVKDVRPAANLEMVISTLFGDKKLDYQSLTNVTKGVFSSRVSVNSTSVLDKIYVVFACIDNSNHTLLASNKSFLLVQGNDFPQLSELKPVPSIVQTGTELPLNCTNNSALYFSWQKIFNNGSVILLAVSLSAADWRYIPNDRYTISEDNVLILSKVTQDDEGVYVCVCGDGISESPNAYNVTVHGDSTGTTSISTHDPDNDNEKMPWWIYLVIIIIVIVCVSLFVLLVKKRCLKKSSQNTEDEQISLLERKISGQKEELRSRLKEEYSKLFKEIPAIIYHSEQYYSIEKIFVMCGMQRLKRGEEGNEEWENVTSYHDLLLQVLQNESPRRVIIEGEPGLGKSTLCLKLAHDWCEESGLQDIDIFVLLRSRKFGKLTSIFSAIKKLYLSSQTELTEKDIFNLLNKYPSAVVLDGFDKYPNRSDSHAYEQIENIMQGKGLHNSFVILTTRSSCTGKHYPDDAVIFRLSGFDEKKRKEYIQKLLPTCDASIIDKRLTTNSVCEDLCQIPLFLALFVQMEEGNLLRQGCELLTVTKVLKNIVDCICKHYQQTREAEGFDNYSAVNENEHLNQLAYDGLCMQVSQLSWTKEEITQAIGEANYHWYCSLGILVEENICNSNEDPRASRFITKHTFYHKLFCEWFASCHLSHCIEKINDENVSVMLSSLDFKDLQYVYRFTCGLSNEATRKIIRHLARESEAKPLKILCILEQPGKVQEFLRAVTDLCSSPVMIRSTDNRSLQRSTIEVLKIAARKEIQIEEICLSNSISAEAVSHNSIKLISGLELPTLHTLRHLRIIDRDREYKEDHLLKILSYSASCDSLEVLGIEECLLPYCLDDKKISSFLNRKEIRVSWSPRRQNKWFDLKLETGFWQNERQQTLTQTEYFQMKEEFQDQKDYTSREEQRLGRQEMRVKIE